MLAYDQLLQVRSVVREYAWNDRDVTLYALGIGLGSDPLSAEQLPFVYEKSLKVAPTFATVAVWGSNPPPGRRRTQERQGGIAMSNRRDTKKNEKK